MAFAAVCGPFVKRVGVDAGDAAEPCVDDFDDFDDARLVGEGASSVALAALSVGAGCTERAQRVAKATALSDAQLARFAVESLIEEAELTPKPALVDARGNGAHDDLDLATMRRSARALEPTFEALARVSRQRTPSTTLRAELAQIGRAGEQAMMHATGGSNAHRGAIWIVGLMIAGAAISGVAGRAAGAASMADSASDRTCAFSAALVCSLGAQIASFSDRFAAPADSNGERVRQRYQVGGARREAQDGFPHAIRIGLPALLHARERGVDENAARVDALLAIMASLDDTCLLHRAGLAGLETGQQGARRVLAAGGSSTAAGRTALAALDRALVALNASPGGAADLLAATLFLDKLSRHDFTGSTASWNI